MCGDLGCQNVLEIGTLQLLFELWTVVNPPIFLLALLKGML